MYKGEIIVSVSTDDSQDDVQDDLQDESVVKTLSKRFCYSTRAEGDDKNYHLCRHRTNHEGQHECCSCRITW